MGRRASSDKFTAQVNGYGENGDFDNFKFEIVFFKNFGCMTYAFLEFWTGPIFFGSVVRIDLGARAYPVLRRDMAECSFSAFLTR